MFFIKHETLNLSNWSKTCSLLSVKLIIHQLYYIGTLANESLVRFPKENSRSSEVCCNDKNLENCLTAEVDPELLLKEEDLSIIDIDLVFHSTIEPNGFVYKNAAGDEAVITYNRETGNMFGSFKTHQDKSYAIEKCHQGYVWKEFNVASFGDDVVEKISLPQLPGMKNLVDAGVADTTTPVNYSVMFYVSKGKGLL